ncbi:MAG: signal transduction histidine kinase [Sulfurimonas sp.]|jgi:signal transduction histidine kinase
MQKDESTEHKIPLKYRITLSILIMSILGFTLISYIYSEWSYITDIKNEKQKLSISVNDASKHIELELLDKLSNTLTIAAAPIVLNNLTKSNDEYKELNTQQRIKKIDSLNKKWIDSESEKDSFVEPYLKNELALYLKKQQDTLRGVYGEIFITNKYGAMIATTAKLTTLSHYNKYWWKEAYSNGDGAYFFDDRGFDASVHGYVVGVVVPIKYKDKVIGILKANVNIIETLSTIIDFYNKTKDGFFKVVRTKGLVVYEEGSDPLTTNTLPKIVSNIKENKNATDIVEKYEENIIIAYSPVKIIFDNKNVKFGGKTKSDDHFQGNNLEIWHIVGFYPEKFALAKSNYTNKFIIYLGIILTFIAAIAAYITGALISRPIEKLQRAQAKIQAQEKLMVAQSRHAAMGEMISMIAHQWRQPLSSISMSANNILVDVELEIVDNETLKDVANGILEQTEELSKTIDDFRDFFKPQKVPQEALLEEVFGDAFGVVGKSLENNNIEMICDFKNEKKLITYSRELMQVIINLLNNAKEALVENREYDRKIFVTLTQNDDGVYLLVSDNAGGIKDDIIEKIFDPYFTTKDKVNGTGLGLYMSKTIVEKHLKGELLVHNQDDGVCFSINLPYTII